MRLYLTALLVLTACAKDTPDTDPQPTGLDPVVESAVGAGALVVTEFMTTSNTCTSTDAPWIELLNTTAEPVSLEGLFISNGVESEALGNITVSPGETVVGTPTDAGPCHDLQPDFRYHPVRWDVGAPLIRIRSNSAVIDSIELDGWWLPPGQALALDPASTSAAANDVRDNWCGAVQPMGASDFGTPGEPNPPCSERLDTADTGDVIIYEPLADYPAGLTINEVSLRPRGCTAGDGQYIELRNISATPLDLAGLKLKLGATIIDVPDQRMSFDGRLFLSTDTECWPSGVVPDVVYGGVVLDGTETIAIGTGDPFVPMDEVDLSMLPFRDGVAMEVSRPQSGVIANDFHGNWCVADSFIHADLQDYGTPGRANRNCNATLQTVGSMMTIGPGDLVITEMMVNPVGCPDFNAQYIEVYNASGLHLDLNRLRIDVHGDLYRYRGTSEVEAGEWALIEYYTAAPAACYQGLRHNLYWEGARLLNGGGEVILLSDVGAVDSVSLLGLATTPGASMSLDPGSVDATANDDPQNWCHADSTFIGSMGDLGTPKAPNGPCTTPRLGP